ncbi:TRAM domain-containing protein [bacterium]|nr:TRAM domain-containing protein [bacterium]
MKIGDIYELKIDKLSNHGLGIGRIDGTVVFVPNSCPDDLLKVKISKINKHYMSADIGL